MRSIRSTSRRPEGRGGAGVVAGCVIVPCPGGAGKPGRGSSSGATRCARYPWARCSTTPTSGARELDELAESIRQHGILQPLLVRPFGQGFELVAGERRLRAAKMVGLKTVPALVRSLSDGEVAMISLVENLQRENLSFFEEAQGYARLTGEFGLTQEELARRVGKSQPSIANKLRLLKLEPEVQAGVGEAGLSERHARALLSLPGTVERLAVIQEARRAELTVKETEDLIARLLGAGGAPTAATRRRVVRVFKDVRIFLNSFRQAVALLRKAGVMAELEEHDAGDRIEVRVNIPKARPSEQPAGGGRGRRRRGAAKGVEGAPGG